MFSWLGRAYGWAFGKIEPTVARWVHDLISGVYGFLRKIFGFVITAWDYFFDSVLLLEHGIGLFFEWVARGFEYLWRHWIPQFLKWIHVHIIVPLLDAWKWISNEGATLWYYITHPDKLAEYLYLHIVKQLEKQAWSTARLLGQFFLSLIVRNLDKVVALVEDILHAVF